MSRSRLLLTFLTFFALTGAMAPTFAAEGKKPVPKPKRSAPERAPAAWSDSTALEWSQVEDRLRRDEGWDPETIQRNPIFLDPTDRREFDVVTSSRSCAAGGCQWHLFEITGSGAQQRLTWKGSFFGRGSVAHAQSRGLFDIDVEARFGTEALKAVLRFDGRRYR